MKTDISGNFIRWSGLAAMVGGALWIVTIIIRLSISPSAGLTSSRQTVLDFRSLNRDYQMAR